MWLLDLARSFSNALSPLGTARKRRRALPTGEEPEVQQPPSSRRRADSTTQCLQPPRPATHPANKPGGAGGAADQCTSHTAAANQQAQQEPLELASFVRPAVFNWREFPSPQRGARQTPQAPLHSPEDHAAQARAPSAFRLDSHPLHGALSHHQGAGVLMMGASAPAPRSRLAQLGAAGYLVRGIIQCFTSVRYFVPLSWLTALYVFAGEDSVPVTC